MLSLLTDSPGVHFAGEVVTLFILARSYGLLVSHRRPNRVDGCARSSRFDLVVALLVLVLARPESDGTRLFSFLSNSPGRHIVSQSIVFFVRSWSQSDILSLRRSFWVNQESRGSVLNLGVSQLMFVLAGAQSDSLRLFSLLTDGPGIHLVDKVVTLLVSTRTEGNVLSCWRSFRIDESTRGSILCL